MHKSGNYEGPNGNRHAGLWEEKKNNQGKENLATRERENHNRLVTGGLDVWGWGNSGINIWRRKNIGEGLGG